jgi:hypothetical protein
MKYLNSIFKIRTLSNILLLSAFISSPAFAYKHEAHHLVTTFLAYWCGINGAAEIGTVDEMVDTLAVSTPYWPLNQSTFHFATSPGRFRNVVVRNSRESRQIVEIALEAARQGHADPVLLGSALHRFQDSWSHEGYAPPFGHASAGTSIDFPSNDIGRALEMAQATYQELESWSKVTRGKSCDRSSEIALQELKKIFSNRQPVRNLLFAEWQTDMERFLLLPKGSLNRDPKFGNKSGQTELTLLFDTLKRLNSNGTIFNPQKSVAEILGSQKRLAQFRLKMRANESLRELHPQTFARPTNL